MVTSHHDTFNALRFSLPCCYSRAMSSTLIIIPTFNEAENIRELIVRLLSLYSDVDILVVDDGSPDGTGAIVGALTLENPRVHLLARQGKGGRGSAVLAGFTFGLARTYSTFIEMDADFSHKPEEIALILEKIRSCDMVVGSRYLPGSEIHAWGFKRTIFSYLANAFARFMLKIPISDYTNGFRCYTRNAVAAIDMAIIDAKGYVVLSEVAMQLWQQGMKIDEIPTIFVNRRRGISNLTLKEIREAFRSVVLIRRIYRGRTRP